MKTELQVYDERNVELEEYEAEVYEAEQEVRESFYHVGMALKRIKDDEPFKPKNGAKPNGRTTFKSWDAYCSSVRCRYTRQHVDRSIRAATQRNLLPELEKRGTYNVPVFWTVTTVDQMARLQTKNDIRVAIAKIRKRLKAGERFTTALVKQVVDEVLGVPRKKDEARKKRLDTTPTLAASLSEMTDTVSNWMDSLGLVEGNLWNEVETESPGTVKRLTQVLSEFISFLKE